MADSVESSAILKMGDTVAITIDNTDGNPLNISYDVLCYEEIPISVYFVDAQGYDDYYDPGADSFDYYSEFSIRDSVHPVMEWTFEEEGVFFIIIANDHHLNPGHTVTVRYEVNWFDESLDAFMYFAVGIIVVFTIILIVMIMVSYQMDGTDEDVAAPEDDTKDGTEKKKGWTPREVDHYWTLSEFGKPPDSGKEVHLEEPEDNPEVPWDPTLDVEPPVPPTPYPKHVVEASERRLGHKIEDRYPPAS
jgi:hypothetical protein